MLATSGRADNCPLPNPMQTTLVGTWYVKCPYDGQIDQVTQGTRQHCHGNHQVFHDGGVTVVCPKGHENFVKGRNLDEHITSWKCSVDKVECSRNPPPS